MPRTGDQKEALMHGRYGELSGVTCRTCPHLEAYANGDCTRVWYKCKLFGESSSPATDWRVGNTACGGFKIPPYEAKRKKLYGQVFRTVKGTRAKLPELKGQISIEEMGL